MNNDYNDLYNIIWQPQAQQYKFMERPEFEALYGGAAGGGKSDSLVSEATRQVDIPHYKGIIFRRTYPQLTELIDKSLLYYPLAFPGADYNATQHTWTFPSGAKIVFGAMQRENDKFNYQGKAFDFIGFDELTHFTYSQYMYLFSRCRPNGPGTRCYIRSTANPGGIGHGWVKDRFITVAPPMTPIKYKVEVEDPDGKTITIERERIFVPATVFDNKILLQNDPNYIATLGMLPEAEKKALLYGDWDSFSGQVFREWRNDPAHYEDRRWTHVIKPFDVPSYWTVYRAMDWGYARPFSVHWYAISPAGRIYCIVEMYGSTGEPNVGVKWYAEKVAEEVYRMEHEHPLLKGREIYGIADPAIFAEDGGPSIAESFEKFKLYFEKGDHERIPGKMQCHYRLAFDEEGIPMFYVFNTCKHFIRTVPTLIYDESKVEDIDTEGEDHVYDEWRYMCQSRPIEPRISYEPNKEWTPPDDDPLNMGNKYEKKVETINTPISL